MEMRGINLLALKRMFRNLDAIAGEEVASIYHDVDALAWYPGEKPLRAWAVLQGYLKRETFEEMGATVATMIKEQFIPDAVTPEAVLRYLPDGYRECARGERIGGWYVEEVGEGTAVLAEDTVTRDAAFGAGVIRGLLETVGASGVRVEVVADACGAGRNRYRATWY